MSVWEHIISRQATRADVLRQLGRPDESIQGSSLAAFSGLLTLSYSEPLVSLFFKDDKVIFIVYVPEEDDLYPRSVSAWENKFGLPAVVLPSSRGKNYHVYVYPEKGKAAVFDANNVLLLIEYFHPMTLEEYIHSFYKTSVTFKK